MKDKEKVSRTYKKIHALKLMLICMPSGMHQGVGSMVNLIGRQGNQAVSGYRVKRNFYAV